MTPLITVLSAGALLVIEREDSQVNLHVKFEPWHDDLQIIDKLKEIQRFMLWRVFYCPDQFL